MLLRKPCLWLVAVMGWWFVLHANAAVTVKGMRLWRAPDNTRIVLDLSGPVEHKLVSASAAGQFRQRIVVTLSGAAPPPEAGNKVDHTNTPIEQLHWSSRDGQSILEIDLSAVVVPKSFLLPANEQYGHRLVLDLFDEDKLQKEQKMIRPAADGLRDIVVAVDAGHGGDDPGAKGAGGLYEKNVTLAIAKELVKLIDATPGYSAFLTRSGDYFVSLRGRTQIARRKNADLFVSIHADAFKDSSAQGAGVFALSERGATSEAARWLAQQENDSDLVGGVNFADKDPLLQEVLLDLSMTATVAASLDMGAVVLRQLGGVTRLHRGHVEQAGFVVLKNPDIPSLLVETGFITNAAEARNLAKPAFRSALAHAIFTGIDSHFRKKPPMDTALAAARGGAVSRTVDKVGVKSDATLEAKLATDSESALVDALANEDDARGQSVSVRRDAEANSKAEQETDALEQLVAQQQEKKTATVQASAKLEADTRRAAVKDSASARKPRRAAPADRHVVARGDTLGGIAARYKVSAAALKKHNRLSDDTVRVGQTLRIPAKP